MVVNIAVHIIDSRITHSVSYIAGFWGNHIPL